MRATLAGAAAMTVGTGVASAEGCDVTEEDRRRVREKWADPERLLDTLAGYEDLIETLDEHDLVEGENDAVLVYARVIDCEVYPEYRVFREVPGVGHVTISFMAGYDYSSSVLNPWEDVLPCQNPSGSCPPYCFTDDCCAACGIGMCGCEGGHTPCDQYCCWTCNCTCNDGNCSHHCPPDNPFPVDVSEQEFDAILAG